MPRPRLNPVPLIVPAAAPPKLPGVVKGVAIAGDVYSLALTNLTTLIGLTTVYPLPRRFKGYYNDSQES